MMDAGFGETEMNLWLSVMDLDKLHIDLYKRYERMVGIKVEEVAMESCSEGLKEEKSLTFKMNDIIKDE